jgi:hypothetical protein
MGAAALSLMAHAPVTLSPFARAACTRFLSAENAYVPQHPPACFSKQHKMKSLLVCRSKRLFAEAGATLLLMKVPGGRQVQPSQALDGWCEETMWWSKKSARQPSSQQAAAVMGTVAGTLFLMAGRGGAGDCGDVQLPGLPQHAAALVWRKL